MKFFSIAILLIASIAINCDVTQAVSCDPNYYSASVTNIPVKRQLSTIGFCPPNSFCIEDVNDPTTGTCQCEDPSMSVESWCQCLSSNDPNIPNLVGPSCDSLPCNWDPATNTNGYVPDVIPVCEPGYFCQYYNAHPDSCVPEGYYSTTTPCDATVGAYCPPCETGWIRRPSSYGCDTCECMPEICANVPFCENIGCPWGVMFDSNGCATCECAPGPTNCPTFDYGMCDASLLAPGCRFVGTVDANGCWNDCGEIICDCFFTNYPPWDSYYEYGGVYPGGPTSTNGPTSQNTVGSIDPINCVCPQGYDAFSPLDAVFGCGPTCECVKTGCDFCEPNFYCGGNTQQIWNEETECWECGCEKIPAPCEIQNSNGFCDCEKANIECPLDCWGGCVFSVDATGCPVAQCCDSQFCPFVTCAPWEQFSLNDCCACEPAYCISDAQCHGAEWVIGPNSDPATYTATAQNNAKYFPIDPIASDVRCVNGRCQPYEPPEACVSCVMPQCESSCKNCFVSRGSCRECPVAFCTDNENCVACPSVVVECDPNCKNCERTPGNCWNCATAVCRDVPSEPCICDRAVMPQSATCENSIENFPICVRTASNRCFWETPQCTPLPIVLEITLLIPDGVTDIGDAEKILIALLETILGIDGAKVTITQNSNSVDGEITVRIEIPTEAQNDKKNVAGNGAVQLVEDDKNLVQEMGKKGFQISKVSLVSDGTMNPSDGGAPVGPSEKENFANSLILSSYLMIFSLAFVLLF